MSNVITCRILKGREKHESTWLLRVNILLDTVNIAEKRKVMINEVSEWDHIDVEGFF
jgi:hypothetical protein